MSTQHTPPEHNLIRATYSPHASADGRAWVFDSRCRRCWYDKAAADYAPLLEAAKAIESAMSLVERRRPQLRAAIAAIEGLPAEASAKAGRKA